MNLGLMQRRVVVKDDCPYIKDGLVFWLDGINKGTTDTSKWIDLIGGLEFAEVNGSNVHGSDCIHLTTSTWLYRDGNLDFPSSTHTIEAAASPSNGWQFLFASRNSANIYKDADGRVRCLTKGARYSITDSKTFSFAGDNIIINGDTVETLTLSSLAMANNVTVINSWSKTAASYCKNFDFYALRIYNRLLTTEEMLYNQREDNERFNLELAL